MEIREPSDTEFAEVKKYVEEFWLDNTNMQKEQFLILLHKNKLTAFGRLRKNNDAIEICTLGVLTEFRKKGFGREMVRALVKAANTNVYGVCVIPEFFRKLGFVEVDEYPASIAKKYQLCSTEYVVDDPYVVMKYSA